MLGRAAGKEQEGTREDGSMASSPIFNTITPNSVLTVHLLVLLELHLVLDFEHCRLSPRRSSRTDGLVLAPSSAFPTPWDAAGSAVPHAPQYFSRMVGGLSCVAGMRTGNATFQGSYASGLLKDTEPTRLPFPQEALDHLYLQLLRSGTLIDSFFNRTDPVHLVPP
jgi:hypothetical protein